MAAVKTTDLTVETLRSVLKYDPETGEFTWLAARSNVPIGARAGTVRADGRLQIKLYGQLYLASRLAWLYVAGAWPEGDIDHKDRNKSNDAFSNLRDAPHGKNMANRTKWRGTSDYLGVQKKRKKWEARICSAGKKLRLGIFETQKDAAKAYNKAAAKTHGEFAVLNKIKG